MESFKNAAIEVLKGSKKPLHYREISSIAIKKGLVKSVGKTPWATMSALLSTDVAKYKGDSLFHRSSPGYYFLNNLQLKNREFGTQVTKTHFLYNKDGKVKTEKREYFFVNPPTLTSKQKGDIGEARVIELISLYGMEGLSCYRPVSDDEGVDIIVKRKEKLDVVYIQVKTSFGRPPSRGFVSTVKERNIKNKTRMLLVFVFFDLTSGDLYDNIFCIPAPEFLKLTENEKKRTGDRVFTVGLNHPEKSKYSEFMIEKRELATRITEIMNRLES